MIQHPSNLLLDEPSKWFVNVSTSACFVSLVQFCHLPVASRLLETQIWIFYVLPHFSNFIPNFLIFLRDIFFKMLVQVFYC